MPLELQDSVANGLFDTLKLNVTLLDNNARISEYDNASYDTSYDKFMDIFDEHRHSLHYPDYEYNKLYFYQSSEQDINYNNKIVGAVCPCILCGNTLDEPSNLHCEECLNSTGECYKCGDNVETDELYYINGEYYCCNCIIRCRECGEYVVINNEYCTENGDVCYNCYVNYYAECDECQNICSNDNMNLIEELDTYVCDDCYRDYLQKMEDEAREREEELEGNDIEVDADCEKIA
jgi:hypothetical protein